MFSFMPNRSMKIKTKFAVLLAFMWLATAINSPADGNSPASPILVELFTSEGCSSCPPADAWLQQIDTSQPAPGAQIIVLSEHVDYWDHDGWKDPHSSHALTERQNEYARKLGLSTPYTPQLIVDGTSEVHLNDAEETKRTFEKAATAPAIPLRLTAISRDGGSPEVIQAHVEADGSSAKNNADVFVAVAIDHVESQVAKGENAGKHLTHVAVVESLEKIGTLKKGKTFDQDIRLKLKPGTDSASLRVIAFLQESGPGRIVGGALERSNK